MSLTPQWAAMALSPAAAPQPLSSSSGGVRVVLDHPACDGSTARICDLQSRRDPRFGHISLHGSFCLLLTRQEGSASAPASATAQGLVPSFLPPPAKSPLRMRTHPHRRQHPHRWAYPHRRVERQPVERQRVAHGRLDEVRRGGGSSWKWSPHPCPSAGQPSGVEDAGTRRQRRPTYPAFGGI